jgi:hypothetical protein
MNQSDKEKSWPHDPFFLPVVLHAILIEEFVPLLLTGEIPGMS